MKTPKETIIFKDDKNKFIKICSWCESPNEKHIKPFTKKWEEKGYVVSGGLCKNNNHI